MATYNLGTFYGYANGSAYGQYACTLYIDSVTRSGQTVTLNNARVGLSNNYPGQYTVNRLAARAGIGGSATNIASNTTLNSYQSQSPNSMTFSLGSPSYNTNGTSVSLYIAFASTGGSSSWGNFQSTPLEWSGSISCPAANPSYTKKPSITDIQETSMIINRGTANITSKFYYDISGASTPTWIELTQDKTTISNLQPNTTYTVKFKVANANDTTLITNGDSIPVTTFSYPYLLNVEKTSIEIGTSQKISLYNPLFREVTIEMKKTASSTTKIHTGTTTAESYSFIVPVDIATQELGATNEKIDILYSCTYNSNTSTVSGEMYTTENMFKPSWSPLVDIDKLILYKDGNQEFVGNISNNDKVLYQGYSDLYYGINYANEAAALSNFNTTIVKYQICINDGVFTDVAQSSIEADQDSEYRAMYTDTKIYISLRAVDGRGYKTDPIIKTIQVLEYSIPKGTITAEREGNYGDIINLTINPIWGVNQNNKNTGGIWCQENGGEFQFLDTIQFHSIEESSVTVQFQNFSNESVFTFKVVLEDKEGRESEPLYATVGIGEPILFVDSEQVGVGVNCFPDNKGFYVRGNSKFYDNVEIDKNLTINTNTVAKGYLVTGAHRFQKFTRGEEVRTGIFWIGGND